ncbi:hypothetical protein BGZ89_006942, partial [Linnemannia elongata]
MIGPNSVDAVSINPYESCCEKKKLKATTKLFRVFHTEVSEDKTHNHRPALTT